MPGSDPNHEEAGAMILVAEELLSEARVRSQRVGINGEVGALTVLGHAYAMAIADAAGKYADIQRLQDAVHIGGEMLEETVPLYWQTRTRR